MMGNSNLSAHYRQTNFTLISWKKGALKIPKLLRYLGKYATFFSLSKITQKIPSTCNDKNSIIEKSNGRRNHTDTKFGHMKQYRGPDKVSTFTSKMPIEFLIKILCLITCYNRLESSHRDDFNKWSDIGFSEEITLVVFIEVNLFVLSGALSM